MLRLPRLLLAPGKRTIDLILRHEPRGIVRELTVRVRLSGPLGPGPVIVPATEQGNWFREIRGLPPYDPVADAQFPSVPADTETETHLPIHLRCSSGIGLVRVYIQECDADIGIPVHIPRPDAEMTRGIPSIVPYPVELKHVERTATATTREDFDGEAFTTVHLPPEEEHS
jgi:hypothetical protein